MRILLRSVLFLLCIVLLFPCLAQQGGNADTLYEKSVRAGELNPNSSNQEETHYKPVFVASLPETVKETSGLVLVNGQLWTINDSGNPPEIHLIDTLTGKAMRSIVVSNALNADWESITQDESYVYVGDFGNNSGNRRNLCILKIAKSDFLNPATETIKASFIYFSYPDQLHYVPAFNKNDFDCEAFFYHNDSLHLFSKNWADLQTRHYTLPVSTGTFRANFIEQFDAGGLITDASINKQGNIVLLGYKNTGGRSYTCFVWLLSGYNGNFFFGGERRRIELGSALHLGQTEGVFLENTNSAWLSSESIQSGWFNEPAKLFRLNLNRFY